MLMALEKAHMMMIAEKDSFKYLNMARHHQLGYGLPVGLAFYDSPQYIQGSTSADIKGLEKRASDVINQFAKLAIVFVPKVYCFL